MHLLYDVIKTNNHLAIKYVVRVPNFWSCAKSFTRTHSQNHPGLLKANLKNHWSKEILPPSSQNCNLFDYFMWSEVEGDVSKKLHSIQDSLRAQISEVMANKDREVVIHPCKMFQSRTEAIVEASGDFIEQMRM